MPLIASDKGGDFDPIPAGTHHAVCYGVVDLGTQPGGQFEPSRKVCIIWELPHERATFPDKNDPNKKVDRPRAISSVFTLSLNAKANLRKTLESWRSRPFTDEELKGFDLKNLIGANCMVSVIHKPGTGKNAGKTYANVNSVSALPKGMVKMPHVNEALYFSLNDCKEDAITFPANMPDWLKAKIGLSDEFLRSQQGHDPQPTEEQMANRTGNIEEDVSF